MCPKLKLTTRRAVHFLRRPRTTQERRHAFIHLDPDTPITSHQFAHLIRPKRNFNRLPNHWDDKPVSLWKHSEFTRRWLQHKNKFISPI